MCNTLHADYKKVALEGEAYKLVHLLHSKWKGLVLGSSVYKVDTDGWIRWRGHLEEQEEARPISVTAETPPLDSKSTSGFCFIPTLKGAFEARETWRIATGKDTKIVEVMYKQGLGRFTEYMFIYGSGIDVLLAKEFKVIKEVGP